MARAKNYPRRKSPISAKYGLWTTLREVPRPAHVMSKTDRYVSCRCDCGVERDVALHSLNRGRSTGCGCVQVAKLTQMATRHGLSRDKLYDTWKCMNARCYDPHHISWPHYGARGIWVCEEWRDTPTAFIEWARSPSNPSPWRAGLTIDRIDSSGNYEPSNCRFVSTKAQARNKKNTIQAIFRGKMTPVVDISAETGIKYTTLLFRLQNGWPPEVAFSLPADVTNRVTG